MIRTLFVFLFIQSQLFSQQTTKIAIIGGGMTGVSAAYYLHKADPNAHITIFEKENKLGGNATTVEVENASGKKIMVDVGPQYFTQGPWNDYLQFLTENNAYHDEETASMEGSIVIQSTQKKQIPFLITPLNGDFRNEKWGKLLKFRKFNIEAHKVFQHPEKWKGITIEKWVNGLKFTPQFKSEIIYPFLAASLGTTISEIKKTAVSEIVKLFAFRKPKQKDTFSVMTKGMGTLIDEIGTKFPEEIQIFRNTEVVSMSNDTILQILQNGKAQTQEFDYIIFATHPYQAAKILEYSYQHQNLVQALSHFTYFDAQIILHKDSNYAVQITPAFLNIFTHENEVIFSTMNLSMISNDFKGIYKSWMQPKDIEILKKNGTFIHSHTFKHPLITPEFCERNEKLRILATEHENLSIVGAWSEGLETQNSAVLSGKRAVQEYLSWKSKHIDN